MSFRALPCRLLLALLVLMPLAAGKAHAADDEPVTVYRCVDAQGHVTLGDVPCARGSEGQAREMQRPQDGTPLNRAVAVEPPAAAPVQPQVVVVRTPQPMYECVTPDGARYTSDSDEGNPRWVPLWTLGYRERWRPGPRRDASRGEMRDAGSPWSRVGAPAPRPDASHEQPRRPGGSDRRHGHAGYGGGGTWVRDDCRALPQAEVCARLTDRRDEIRRRFFNAQERERDTLRVEERGINARLAADCGTR